MDTEDADDEANVLVCVRVRPPSEKESGRENMVTVMDQNCVVFHPNGQVGYREEGIQKRLVSGAKRSREQTYKFDTVFGPSATQQEVYNGSAKHVIDACVKGFNATVFAYGATGSGKTHTMMGNETAGPGVMVLSMRDLFAKMEERRLESQYKICISYLEIYNETIRDLLVDESEPLQLREKASGTSEVSNLSKHYPESANDVREAPFCARSSTRVF